MKRYLFLLLVCAAFFPTSPVSATAENPVIQITSPLSGSFVTGRAEITFTNESTMTPLSAECSLDGFMTLIACTSGQTAVGDLPGFDERADGAFTLSVQDEYAPRAYISDTETGITKDTVVPVVTSVLPATGSSLNSSFELKYTLDSEIASGTITFTRVDGTPDLASHTYTMLRADGESGQHTLTRATLEAGFGNALIEDAMYTISYIVLDNAGNEGAATVSSVVYDAVQSATITNVQISSNASVPTAAAVGHIVTVQAYSDFGSSVVGTIGGKTAVGTKVGRDLFLKRTLDGTETEGAGLNFTLTLRDASGNAIASVTKANIVNGTAVETIFTPPMIPRTAPVAGTYTGSQNIFFEPPGSMVTIRYTTNGTTPSCTTGSLYVGAITLTSSTTIKARSCDSVGNSSALGTFAYTINASGGGSGGSSGGGGGSTSPTIPGTPVASPVTGSYTGTQYVTLLSTGATSIRYTTNKTLPTCTTGTVYIGPIQVSATGTIIAKGCNVSGLGSANATFAYTIKPGSTTTTAPIVSTPGSNTPVTVTTTPQTSVTPVPSVVSIHDPALYAKLLLDFGLKSDPVDFERNKALIRSDATSFGIVITDEQIRAIANFVTYGASTETIKLGSGERHAVIRDYFETVGRGDVVWDDIQRLTIGQKPVKRNLAKEQAQVPIALTAFTRMTGHAPNFQNASEDLAWNTLMYRIRFTRNLVKEQNGINRFQNLYKRSPVSPFDWSIVRALGYVLY